MMAQGGTNAHPSRTGPPTPKKAHGVSAVVPPPEVMHVLHEKNKKPRPMIPSRTSSKLRRAQRQAAGAEQPAVVMSTAAQELKVSAKAKGEKAAAARRAAVAEAAKAEAAAAKASRAAKLAEEAKAVAAGLDKARASRAAKDEYEKPNLDDVASDEVARRLHSEMNASPRLSRRGEPRRRSFGNRRCRAALRPFMACGPIRPASAPPRMSTTTTATCFFLPQLYKRTH